MNDERERRMSQRAPLDRYEGWERAYFKWFVGAMAVFLAAFAIAWVAGRHGSTTVLQIALGVGLVSWLALVFTVVRWKWYRWRGFDD